MMIEVEIVLGEKLAGKLEAIAGGLGVGLEILVVMACQKYARWVEEHGLPMITAVGLGGDLIEPCSLYRTEGQDQAEDEPIIVMGDQYRRRR